MKQHQQYHEQELLRSERELYLHSNGHNHHPGRGEREGAPLGSLGPSSHGIVIDNYFDRAETNEFLELQESKRIIEVLYEEKS
jgi:hypothetical protein